MSLKNPNMTTNEANMNDNTKDGIMKIDAIMPTDMKKIRYNTKKKDDKEIITKINTDTGRMLVVMRMKKKVVEYGFFLNLCKDRKSKTLMKQKPFLEAMDFLLAFLSGLLSPSSISLLYYLRILKLPTF